MKKLLIIAALGCVGLIAKAQLRFHPFKEESKGDVTCWVYDNGAKVKHTFKNAVKVDSFYLNSNGTMCKKTIKCEVYSKNHMTYKVSLSDIVSFSERE